jgi:hypothetical protein
MIIYPPQQRKRVDLLIHEKVWDGIMSSFENIENNNGLDKK